VALLEKAVRGHFDLLVALSATLLTSGWRTIEEIRGAVDLWAISPAETGGKRVIFEAKTVGRRRSGLQRTRAGLAQLLEYRFYYGDRDDGLCLVLSNPVSDERIRFLRTHGVDVIWLVEDRFVTRGSPVEPVLETVATFVG
jgi:hypothetical protein